MYYFTYYDGNIYVHYEFCDSDSVVDSFNVFDVKKINKWCKMDLPFPYEINEESIFLLLCALECKEKTNLFLKCFKDYVSKCKIKIYCEEKK